MKAPHVVMISDYETLGGAAVAASRLADCLAPRMRVSRCVLYTDGKDHSWHTRSLFPEQPRPAARWRRFLRRPRHPRSGLDHLRHALDELQPDIINLHNLHSGTWNGWSVEFAAICAEYAPVAWTLHDMWSFTGRCAYSYDCELFRHGCDARCPTPTEHPPLPPANIAPAWQRRRDVLADLAELVAITPSRWLARQAAVGLWAGHRIEVIPYGVPLDTFRPLPRPEARALLGIEARGPVLLLAAQELSERRKGGLLLPLLWNHVPVRPLTLVTMGQGKVDIKDPDINLLPLGWVDDPHRQALIYSAADAVLHPAPVDNLPNVLLEALACGTPAIALPIGGVPEIIRPGESGWLAADVSLQALGAAVSQAVEQLAAGLDLRSRCRHQAAEQYSFARQANSYEQLFGQLASGRVYA